MRGKEIEKGQKNGKVKNYKEWDNGGKGGWGRERKRGREWEGKEL